MSEKRINYTNRDFVAIRQDLINYVNSYYPDLIGNFNDASIFSVLMDLNAAVTDNLHFHIDRSIQETVLQYAQQKSSVFNIARTYGLKIPGQRPSVSLVDFSITVPVFGDKEDERYLGILRRGSQVSGAGQIFENVNDIDFSSPFNSDGFPNRLKIPNFDSNNILINYTITKREVVVNGITKVFKKVITPADVKPFLELFLPEKNVLGVTSIIQKDGTTYSNVPSYQEFLSSVNRWYEVDALVEDRIFIEDQTKPSDSPGVKVGKYITTNQRFITEFTPQGYMKLTFGGGSVSAEDQLREFTRLGTPLNIQKYQNNMSLGSTLKPNTTLFIQYRVGGGISTNLGVNVINQVNTVNFAVSGPSQNVNQSVINSLRCNNVTAAIGGANAPTLEEIRNYVTFNFASQNRAVTINDYEVLIKKMPGMFGAPAKVAIMEEDNKIKIKILSYDSSGKLTPVVSNTLKNNLAEYLSNYRMINDYISIETAEIIDIGIDISVVLNGTQNQGALVTNIIDTISNYFNPLNRNLGENVFLSDLKSQIQSLNGVITITELKVFNKVGGQYSSSETSQNYLDNTTKEINPVDDMLFAEPKQIYQIRFPEKDITVRVKNYRATMIS
jgi:hypothetical protein